MSQRRTRIISGLIMAVFMAGAIAPACFAQAGDEIIHLDFDDGSVCGFETYIEGGACTLRNDGGRLAADITSCGSVDYANQAYRDGFALEQNCTYNYSFDISGSIDREVEYRLQLNGGDYHAYLGDKIRIGPETSHISVDWTMTEASDPAPRLCFNMGYAEDMSADPGAHTVWIDNISLKVLDDSAAAGGGDGDEEGSGADGISIAINQAGYRPADTKTVLIRLAGGQADDVGVQDDTSADIDGSDSESGAVTLSAVDESGNTVLELTAEDPFYDSDSGAQMTRADFSALTQPGTYRIRASAGEQEVLSEPFEIAEGVYDPVLRSAFQMLYLQRCGTEVSLPDEPGAEPFSHGICHDSQALIYGTDQTKDVSGGWHDAGDYGRYVVPGAKTVADLFLAYEQFAFDGDDMGIPESGNGVPDVLDEARWELEWMLKMQDEETGGVYHKVTCRSFPGEIRPEEETDELVICPVSLTATLDFAAVMAKASVLYRPYDPDFARTALSAAQKAWSYGKDPDSGDGFHNPPEVSTGEYPDGNAQDERLWAATELYLAEMDSLSAENVTAEDRKTEGRTSDDSQAAQDQEQKAVPNPDEAAGLLANCQDHGLGWQCVSDYALIDLALSDEGEASLREQARERLSQYGQQLLERSENNGYYMTLGGDYPWGSNMTVANNGFLLAILQRMTEEESCAVAAKRHLDYLLGANPTTYCYVTGQGTFAPEHPHHRPSQAAGTAMNGMLAGGPNAHLEDPYAQNVLAGQAPALCYADNAQSYSTNEVAIYWNSPLITLLAASTKELY